MDHWRRGHKQMCKKIHRGGNAEQYNADKKYKEAVAVAVEACTEDTKGQTCYICTQALHWKTKEGLVRMCACRGTAGFAHVSCLAEQAKILHAEAEEKNLGLEAGNARWIRWYKCGLCEQNYHGVVRCALGWACWKTYVGRPETDGLRRSAMSVLGAGLSAAGRNVERLGILEIELAEARRLGRDNEVFHHTGNLALCYSKLGRHEEALELEREVHAIATARNMENFIFDAAVSLSKSLLDTRRYEEAKSFLGEQLPKARRALGPEARDVLKLRLNYAAALFSVEQASRDDVAESVTILEELESTVRRVYGPEYPFTKSLQSTLKHSRLKLAAFGPP